MSLDKLLNHVEHTFLTGDVSDQILAIQILSRFPHTKHLLLKGLDSNIIDVVITCLECLALDKNAPITSIIHCLNNWDDSEVKLAALNAIERNLGLEQSHELLIDLICDTRDYWEGDWNDGDDIRLNAARILDNHAQNLECNQALRLLPLLQNDPEPDLRSRLVSVLSRHSPALLEEGGYLKHPTDFRLALKSTPDKISLYKAAQHQDLRCQQIAYQRLSEMNCREYLQLFLTGLSHSDSKIRQTSINTLARWEYQIGIKHLTNNELLSEIPIRTLSTLLSDEDKQHLINRWQDQQHPTQNLTAILRLISRLKETHKQAQLKYFMPVFYERFSNLDEGTQLDCLNILFSETTQRLSTAFVRQHLQSEISSNSVRQQLIGHLVVTPTSEHQAYLKELVVGLPEILVNSHVKKQEPSANDQRQEQHDLSDANIQPPVLSTLEALKRTAHPSLDRKQSPNKDQQPKKKASIEKQTNQALAIEHCRNKQWLIDLCVEQKLATLSKTAFHALVTALYRNNINFIDIKTPQFSHLVSELIIDVDCSNLSNIVDWLGELWIEQHHLQRIESENLALQVCLVRYITSEPQLLQLLKHPYIGIQIAALEQLRQTGITAQERLINLILKEPILYPQFNHFEATTVYKVLSEKIQGSPSIALQAMHSFMGSPNNPTA